MGGIASRLAIYSSLIALVATVTAGFLVYRGAENSLMQSASDRVAHTAETAQIRTLATIGDIGQDVRFLAQTPPVQGIVRARVRRGLDPMWAMRDDEWGVQLAETFRAFLESRPLYLRARFVGLVDDGRELVRVERRDGEAVFADVAEFRTLGDMPYVQKAADLAPGQLYLSTVRWGDAEDGITAETPLLYISTPVHTQAGETFGVLVVTVDFGAVLRPLRSLLDANQTLYVADDGGDLLLVTNRSAGEVRASGSITRPFPEAQAVLAGPPGEVRMLDAPLGADTRGIVYLQAVAMDGGAAAPGLVVGVSEPHETIFAGVRRVRNGTVAITLVLCLAAVALALASSRYITNPIRHISRAVASLGAGENRRRLPVDRRDEIGVLARSFVAMEGQIQDQIRSLEDEERRQRTIVETAAEGIVVVDEAGRIESFNPAAESIFACSSADVVGRKLREILPSFSWEKASAGGDAAGISGVETSGIRSDGVEVDVAVLWSSFDWRDTKKHTIIVQDIRERKEAEASRERLVRELESERRSLRELSRTLEERVRERTAELEQLNRELNASNRELQEITNVASHDLQEPLRKLRAFADLLECEHGHTLDESGRFYAQRIFQLAERMSSLLNDLLAFSHVASEIKVVRDVDLHGIALEVIEEMRPIVEETNAAVHVETLPQISADPKQMRKLLENLVENALAYTRPETPPVVYIRGAIDEDASRRRVYRIEVEDNGLGIDEKYTDRIFAPFERLHGRRTPDRTGMGLTICRRIVENHLGHITVRSTPGVGSTFVVTIPANGTKLQAEENHVA